MKSRGQLSFDFIFTLIVALVFMQFINNFSGVVADQQSVVSVYQQEENIAMMVHSVLGASKILDFNSSQLNDSMVEVMMPYIIEMGGNLTSTDCDISLVGGLSTGVLTITHEMSNGEIVEYKKNIPYNGPTIVGGCGQKFGVS